MLLFFFFTSNRELSGVAHILFNVPFANKMKRWKLILIKKTKWQWVQKWKEEKKRVLEMRSWNRDRESSLIVWNEIKLNQNVKQHKHKQNQLYQFSVRNQWYKIAIYIGWKEWTNEWNKKKNKQDSKKDIEMRNKTCHI